jgi:hypothetical protein
MSRAQRKRGRQTVTKCACAFLTLSLALGCGGRTSLSTPFQSETIGGAFANGGAGSAGRAGSGSATGGFMAGGAATGSAGTFAMAGTVSAGGVAGEPGQMCTLPLSDCRTADQLECALTNPLCEGKIDLFDQISSLQQAHVVDVTTATDGRVAVAGYFEGALRSESSRDNLPLSLIPDSAEVDAFVVSFDANGKVEWALAYSGGGEQRATGLDFAPSGKLIVQGSSVDHGFVMGIDAKGNELWSTTFEGGELAPGQVAVDNNGIATLIGHFNTRVRLSDGTAVYSALPAPYLIRMDQDGQTSTLQAIRLNDWPTVESQWLAVDDEDNVIIAGNARGEFASVGFVMKQTPAGNVSYYHDWKGADQSVSALTVDREMRVTLGGKFYRELQFLGQDLQATVGRDDVWLAQLDRNGELNWLRNYSTEGERLDHVGGLTVDGPGNLALVGVTDQSLYVRKLRSNGDPIWLRTFETTQLEQTAIAASNDRSLWVAGSFSGSLHWSDFSVARGSVDGFLLRLGP